MTDQILPLLSNSLQATLETLNESTPNVITRSLLEAQYNQTSTKPTDLQISDYATMITIRRPDEEDPILSFSFLPKGKKPSYTLYGTWGREGRQLSTPGKVARALLEDSSIKHVMEQTKYNNRWCNYLPSLGVVSRSLKDRHEYKLVRDSFPTRKTSIPVQRYADTAYEHFNNVIKAVYQDDIDFELVKGEDISRLYSYTNYYGENDRKGTLWESCMREMSRETFKLYDTCPNCRMLVAYKDEKIVGRALVWDTNEGVYMDRVYFYEDYHLNSFINYAIDQKWAYKRRPNSTWNEKVMMYEDGKYVCKENVIIEVKGTDASLTCVPYLDTLKYQMEDGTLTNDCNADWINEFESPDGDISDTRATRNEPVYDEDGCDPDTQLDLGDLTETVEEYYNCAVTGIRAHVNSMHYVDSTGWVLPHLAVQDYEDDMILVSNALTLHDGRFGSVLDTDVIQLADGRYAIINECTMVDAEWYLDEDVSWDIQKDCWVVTQPTTGELVSAEEMEKLDELMGYIRDANIL